MSRRFLAAAVALCTAALASPAGAFCGFYVSGADGQLFNDATQVVLMREGTRTVLSMQNDYKGPPEDFALVVPVPIILQKENVKTLPRAVFAKIDQLGAPRLVEYWEQDPCPKPQLRGKGYAEKAMPPVPAPAMATERRSELGVRVEAQFDVGEYEIVILSAKDALGLDTWLRENNYKIPKGADVFLRPYVQAGSKFFVAKVNAAKVQFEEGRAALSPLRVHYDSETFTLPIRLGLINSGGKQDLIVSVLAKGQRYEVANYPNVAIPTNLDVAEAARGEFGSFYATLFDHTLEKHPRAVVTEYAWDASTCDPCPGPALYPGDFATLGADVLPSAQGEGPPQAIVDVGAVVATQASEQRGIAARAPVFATVLRSCLTRAMESNRTLTGKATINVQVNGFGEVETVTVPEDVADAETRTCLRAALNKQSFPAIGKGQHLTVSIPLTYRPGPSVLRPSFAAGFVLTRLHARYGQESLGEDLVFRAASPITGGREVRASEGLEQGARSAGTNNFQGRYAIRHPWAGAIDCKEPRRGVWGGPPHGMATPPDYTGVRPAVKLAHAKRNLQLASFVGAAVPLGNVLGAEGPEPDPVKAIGPGTGAVSGAAPAPEGPGPAGSERVAITPQSGEGTRQRCGSCAIVARGDGERSALAAGALALLAGLARRRRARGGG